MVLPRSFIFYWILAVSLQHVKGMSVYAEISHQLADRFNLACMDILHRPQKISSLHRVFKWVKGSRGNRPLGMATLAENQNIKKKDRGPHRCMHLVMAEFTTPEIFAEYTKTSSLHLQFWLIFLHPNETKFFFNDAVLPFSTEVLAVELQADQMSGEIFDVSRTSVNSSVRIHPVGSWTLAGGMIMSAAGVKYKKRLDLEGIRLRIATMENWPVSYQLSNGEWSGLFPTIWRQVEKDINVTTEYIRANSTGSIRSNGKWSGMIGRAERHELDVIVSEVTMNARRSDVIDFTLPLVKSKYQIYFKQPGLLLDWMAVLKPFPSGVWIAILFWVLSCSLIMSFCYYYSVCFGLERGAYPRLGTTQFVLYVLQALSNQALDILPQSFTCRIIVLTSYLVSAVIIPSYSASLISSLTTRTPYRPFNSLSEMLQDGTYKLLVANNTAEYDYFASSKDPTISRAFTRLVETVPPHLAMRNISGALETVCREDRYAVFGVDAVLNAWLSRQSAEGLKCRIIPMLRPMSTVHLSMALPKNHHLHSVIDYYLNLMVERGFIAKISNTVWRTDDKGKSNAWREVTPEEVFQIFILLIFGAMASTVILLLELIWAKRKKTLKLAKDLLHPSPAEEKRKHKKKRLVQHPNSYFMDVKCPGCYKITTVFSHAQTEVVCTSCSNVLCKPTGGRARLTEGCSFRRKQH